MSGTVEGGLKATKTVKKRHGKDFYKKIGAMGGVISRTGGFGSYKVGSDGLTGVERARLAGSKGGSVSKRGKARVKELLGY